MTISSQVRTAGPFTGNGVATGGPFTFKVFSETEVTVVQTTDLGVDSTLVYGTDFNVTLNADQNAAPGGTINYLIAGVGPSLIPTGYVLNATSNVSNLQPVALTNAGGLFPKVINDALDRLTILVQQVLRGVNASLKFPLSDGTSISAEIPNKTARALKYLFFDANGAPIATTGTNSSPTGTAGGDLAGTYPNPTVATLNGKAAAGFFPYNGRICGTAGGTANALTVTPNIPLVSYADAQLEFSIAAANTTEAMTINASGLGNKSLKVNLNGTKRDPAIGMFQAGMRVIGTYDGTDVVVDNAPWDNQASDIAAAATVALASVTGNFANLTGTGGPVTAITGLTKGRRMLLRHTGIQTLTHSATLFLLNNATNITTAVGDISEWATDGTNVYMTRYHRANGQPLQGLTGSLTGITDINGGQLGGFRNRIINGDFRCWDYATTYALTTSIAYGSANRWAAFQVTAANGAFNRSIFVPSSGGFRYSAALGRTAASVSTNVISCYQNIETANAIPLQGKVVTLSWYAAGGTNFSAAANALNYQVSTGTGVDQATTLVGSWTGEAVAASGAVTLSNNSYTRYQTTFTVPANATQIYVQFKYTPTGTAGADDNAYITGVQLEPGSVATPFEDRGEAVERMLCARYLPVFSGANCPLGNMQCLSTTAAQVNIPFTVPTRIAPTGLTISAPGHVQGLQAAGAATVATGFTFNNANISGLTQVSVTGMSGLVAGNSSLLVAGSASFKLLVTGAEL